jgi:hypothetical protein
VARGLISHGDTEHIAASLVTVGETLVALHNKVLEEKISKQDFRNATAKLSEYLLGGELGVCGWGSTSKELRTMIATVMDADDRIESSDALIVATALLCNQCRHLYTSDGKLIESEGIHRLFKARMKGIGEAATRAKTVARRLGRYGGRR